MAFAMSDYQQMYRVLFQETTKAIFALQNAQRRTEEMYMADDGREGMPNGFVFEGPVTGGDSRDDRKDKKDEKENGMATTK